MGFGRSPWNGSQPISVDYHVVFVLADMSSPSSANKPSFRSRTPCPSTMRTDYAHRILRVALRQTNRPRGRSGRVRCAKLSPRRRTYVSSSFHSSQDKLTSDQLRTTIHSRRRAQRAPARLWQGLAPAPWCSSVAFPTAGAPVCRLGHRPTELVI